MFVILRRSGGKAGDGETKWGGQTCEFYLWRGNVRMGLALSQRRRGSVTLSQRRRGYVTL